MTAHWRTTRQFGKRPPQAALPAPAGSADKAERFRALALPHLDDVFTLARYLLRDPSDAEDAAQECYLRAFRHFETFRGDAIKPWLLAILRNVCRAEFARRARLAAVESDSGTDEIAGEEASPEEASLARLDGETAQRLIAALSESFREVLVLREINDLNYREIADVIGAPVGTVMSRLARARRMLRAAWTEAER